MRKKTSYHHGDLKNALIEAGIKILSKEGVSGLSLRQVARQAGVSHTAPYAHFADKQALIAAISTEGYRKLYEQFSRAVQKCEGNPKQQLMEMAWAYMEFALNNTDHFKITLSGAIEKEKDYPAFVEMTKKSFDLVVKTVEGCQKADVLPEGPSDLIAVSLWGMLHGIVSLAVEEQISHTILDRMTLKELLEFSLNLIMLPKVKARSRKQIQRAARARKD